MDTELEQDSEQQTKDINIPSNELLIVKLQGASWVIKRVLEIEDQNGDYAFEKSTQIRIVESIQTAIECVKRRINTDTALYLLQECITKLVFYSFDLLDQVDILNAYEETAKQLEQLLNQNPPHSYTGWYIQILMDICEQSDSYEEDEESEIDKIIHGASASIVNYFSQQSTIDLYVKVLPFIFERLPNEAQDTLGNLLFEEFKRFDVTRALAILAEFMQNTGPYTYKVCERLIEIFCTKYSISVDHFKLVLDRPSNFVEEIPYLIELTQMCPGAVDWFYNESGLTNLSRYPLPVIVDMFKESDIFIFKNRKYVLMIYPFSDHNGAFTYAKKTYTTLYKDLKALGYTIKIIECWTSREIVVKSARVQKQFGNAEGIVMLAHGKRKSMHLSYGQYLKMKNLDTIEGQVVDTFFRNRDTPLDIVFDSCSTGAKDGLAQNFSSMYDLSITAPRRPTAVQRITPVIEDGQLKLKAEYHRTKAKSYVAGNLI